SMVRRRVRSGAAVAEVPAAGFHRPGGDVGKRHRLAGRGRANLETELGDAGPAARDGEGCTRRWRTVGGHHDGLDELGRADAELTTGAGARLRDLECDTVVARLGELMGDAGALAVRRAVSP